MFQTVGITKYLTHITIASWQNIKKTWVFMCETISHLAAELYKSEKIYKIYDKVHNSFNVSY